MYIEKKTLIRLLIGIFLLVGVGVAVYLSQQEQDIRQQAAVNYAYDPTQFENYNEWKDSCIEETPLVDGLRGCVTQRGFDGKAYGIVRNTTNNKTFTVGIGSYKAYLPYPDPYPTCKPADCPDQYEWIWTQTFHDGLTASLGPGQTVYMEVNVPACTWQVDIFEGQLLKEFKAPTQFYSGENRFIDGWYETSLDQCVPVSPTPPACIADEGTCEWDPVTGATGYTYTIVEEETNKTIKEGTVGSTVTKVTFTVNPNNTYTCSVAATNVCGTGPEGEASATCAVSPTPSPTEAPTPTPTPTSVPSVTPTPTRIPTPTPTRKPSPTNTPMPTPTPTRVPPTPTPTPIIIVQQPPTPTPTPIIVVVEATPTPTPTPVPPGVTVTPTPTIAPPGSALQTITVVGGLVLTALGALVLFIL